MSHCERIDENTIIFFFPNDNYIIQQTKNLFYEICKENQLFCYEKDLCLIGEMKLPFITQISIQFKLHATKGYLGIIQVKPIAKLHIIGTVLIPSFLTCEKDFKDCNYWYQCPKHWIQGIQKFNQHFIDVFAERIKEQKLSYIPPDNFPVCLSAICLPINSNHKSFIGYNEKIFYYFDLTLEHLSNQILIQIQSVKRIQCILKKNEIPSAWKGGNLFISNKQQDGTYSIEILLNNSTKPILQTGRWFFALKVSSLLFKSEISVSLTSIEYPPDNKDNTNNRLSISNLMPDNDEDEWVIVADDSSAKGRKLKPQLVGSFNSMPSTVKIHCLPNEEASQSFVFDPHTGKELFVPDSFICPITRDIMIEPVVAADGFTYEYSAIKQWLEGYIRSPMTGEQMEHKILVPNHNLKSQIEQWKTNNNDNNDNNDNNERKCE